MRLKVQNYSLNHQCDPKALGVVLQKLMVFLQRAVSSLLLVTHLYLPLPHLLLLCGATPLTLTFSLSFPPQLNIDLNSFVSY